MERVEREARKDSGGITISHSKDQQVGHEKFKIVTHMVK